MPDNNLTLEQRIIQLEATVKNLNSILTAAGIIGGIGGISIGSTQSQHAEVINKQGAILDQHATLINQNIANISKLAGFIDQNGGIINQHTKVINEIVAIINRHFPNG